MQQNISDGCGISLPSLSPDTMSLVRWRKKIREAFVNEKHFPSSEEIVEDFLYWAERGRDCKLRNLKVSQESFIRKASDPYLARMLLRKIYTEHISWGFMPADVQKFLYRCAKRLQRDKGERQVFRVHELFAGHGWLCRSQQKRSKAIEWYAYDSEPKQDWVEELSTEGWLEHVKPEHVDMVFFSWIPYKCTLGSDILMWCKDHGKPLIWVGEGIGGCTGDEKFWATLHAIKGFYTEGCKSDYRIPDVCSWEGIHDYLSMWFPTKEMAIEATGVEDIEPSGVYFFDD
tara:strand:- start:79 stop:939 length:861 start_codon:yes stop_codon:yes gene_type:complete